MGAADQHAPTRASDTGGLEQYAVGAVRALADVLAVMAGFALSYNLSAWAAAAGLIPRTAPEPEPYRAVALLFAAICVLVFARLGLYRHRVSVLNLWELQTATKGVVHAAAYFFALQFFLKLGGYSRLVVVGAVVVTLVLVILERRLLSAVVARLQRRGWLGRTVVIYGCGATGRLLMKKLVQAPHTGYRVIGFLDDSAPVGSLISCRTSQTGGVLFQVPVLGRWREWEEIVARYQVDEVLVTAPNADPDKLRELFHFARGQALRVGVVPHLEEVRADQLQVEELSAIPVLRPFSASSEHTYLALKRLMDVVGAVLLLVLTAPLWVVAVVGIRLDSPGRVLFVQERIGLNGRRFRMLKFRTMRADTAPYAPSPQGDVEPRITRFGRVLRTGGFDELPQLINVLRNEMSLVGPRPEMPFIVHRYSPLERQRLQAKPGLTGLWQLSADRHAEIHENIEYDLYYIRHRSIAMDVLILLETLFFTIGTIVRTMTSRRPQDRRPAALPAAVGGANEPYVLVALDQRHNGSVPARWQTFLPAACALAERWPVKLLVAAGNVAAYDALLRESARPFLAGQCRPEYVPYQGRAGLRSLIAGARLVITDLPHVIAWVSESGKDLLAVDDDGLRWPARSPSAEVLNALAQALPNADGRDLPSTFGTPSQAHVAG